MRCPYCSKPVVGEKDVVVLAGEGPAHRRCYEHDVMGQRSFAGLKLSSFLESELNELQEMILIELNARSRIDLEKPTDNVVELF